MYFANTSKPQKQLFFLNDNKTFHVIIKEKKKAEILVATQIYKFYLTDLY